MLPSRLHQYWVDDNSKKIMLGSLTTKGDDVGFSDIRLQSRMVYSAMEIRYQCLESLVFAATKGYLFLSLLLQAWSWEGEFGVALNDVLIGNRFSVQLYTSVTVYDIGLCLVHYHSRAVGEVH